MGREIKFRAWDKDSKRYGEVVEIEYNESREIDGIWVWYNIHERYEPIPGANVTVEQYTGLKDKNGKEIYEGDVVKLDDLGGVTYVDEPVKIVWEDGAFIMKCTKHNQIITDEYGAPWVIGFMVKGIFEVIGNIHENPELLEDK